MRYPVFWIFFLIEELATEINKLKENKNRFFFLPFSFVSECAPILFRLRVVFAEMQIVTGK